MRNRTTGLALSLTFSTSLALPIAALAQPAPAPIPTATPYVFPSSIPAGSSPIPIPSPVTVSVPAVAPGFSAPNVGTPNADIAGVAQSPFVGISLQDAVTMALARNTDIAVSQANRRIAAFQIVAAEGSYDVHFQLVPSYSHSVQPPVALFQSGPGFTPYTTDTLGANLGFSGQTIGGTRYNVTGSGSRVTSNLSTNAFNPYYPTALSFSLTQPLARGLQMDEARRELELARIGADADTDALLATAQQSIANVADTYWDLVAAWRNVAIQQEGLNTALAQAQSNQRLVKQGAAAPVDVVESNDQVNTFQDNVFSALQNVQRLQTQLKSLILANPTDPAWMANLVPTTSVTQLPPEETVDSVLIAALASRPEVAQLREARRQADVNAKYAREQMKPQVDLGLGYTTNGFAGNPLSPQSVPTTALFIAQSTAINQLIAVANKSLPPNQQIPFLPNLNFNSPNYLTGGFGTSVNNLTSNRFPTYVAQVTIGLPLQNRTARGNYDAALEQERSLIVQQIALIQRLKLESANAVQSLRSARSRVIAARSAREAAEQVYASEVRKFRAGTSTTFLVLQRALNLSDNRGRELQAQTDLNKALVELERVRGRLFTSYNLDPGTLGTRTLMLTGSQVPGAISHGTPPSAPPTPAPSQTIPPAVRP
ncbi:MAG: TolC family protein [Candidatus Eremiobacteraeota bacterium]|nr:TolC family protein [Candidatus Eremiobacteraeota bacterium]